MIDGGKTKVNNSVDIKTNNKNYSFVDSVNDSKYKAYNDSLFSYNVLKEYAKNLGKFYDRISEVNYDEPTDDYSIFFNKLFKTGEIPKETNLGAYEEIVDISEQEFDNITNYANTFFKNTAEFENIKKDDKTYLNILKSVEALKKIKIKPTKGNSGDEMTSAYLFDKPTHKVFAKGTKAYDIAKKQELIGAEIDGIWGQESEQKLQEYLKSNVSKEIKQDKKNNKQIKENTIIEKPKEKIYTGSPTNKYVVERNNDYSKQFGVKEAVRFVSEEEANDLKKKGIKVYNKYKEKPKGKKGMNMNTNGNIEAEI